MNEIHIGRSWTGNSLEQECPCPKAACGLVQAEDNNMSLTNDCSEHSFLAAKTIRQIHSSENCPAK